MKLFIHSRNIIELELMHSVDWKQRWLYTQQFKSSEWRGLFLGQWSVCLAHPIPKRTQTRTRALKTNPNPHSNYHNEPELEAGLWKRSRTEPKPELVELRHNWTSLWIWTCNFTKIFSHTILRRSFQWIPCPGVLPWPALGINRPALPPQRRCCTQHMIEIVQIEEQPQHARLTGGHRRQEIRLQKRSRRRRSGMMMIVFTSVIFHQTASDARMASDASSSSSNDGTQISSIASASAARWWTVRRISPIEGNSGVVAVHLPRLSLNRRSADLPMIDWTEGKIDWSAEREKEPNCSSSPKDCQSRERLEQRQYIRLRELFLDNSHLIDDERESTRVCQDIRILQEEIRFLGVLLGLRKDLSDRDDRFTCCTWASTEAGLMTILSERSFPRPSIESVFACDGIGRRD